MNPDQIVIECHRLALDLKQKSAAWLHTTTNRRNENAGFELASAADAMYSYISNHTEIMGSDTGKPSFDEQVNPDFQEDMQSLWDQEEPDFRRVQE